MAEITVISLGGSIIVPKEVDVPFLTDFTSALREFLGSNPKHKLIIVTGGGAPARMYQQAYRSVQKETSPFQEDLIGIAATHLNAQLLYSLFEEFCSPVIVSDPTAKFSFSGQLLIAAGWKPGFSTDNDAVVLAERFGADRVINLSNIPKIYSADPKMYPSAVPLDHISWKQFREMIGDTWTPGSNLPFDPIAAQRAADIGLQVITADGRDIDNTLRILKNRSFIGTTVGPEWQDAGR